MRGATIAGPRKSFDSFHTPIVHEICTWGRVKLSNRPPSSENHCRKSLEIQAVYSSLRSLRRIGLNRGKTVISTCPHARRQFQLKPRRYAGWLAVLAIFAITLPMAAQSGNGISLAASVLSRLTGGQPLAGITLNGNAEYFSGSDENTGTFTLQVQGPCSSRVSLQLTSGQMQWLRGRQNYIRKAYFIAANHAVSDHSPRSAWIDAAWFDPGLGLLTELSAQNAAEDGRLMAENLGAVTHNGIPALAIKLWLQLSPSQASVAAQKLIARRSQEILYISPVTLLPEFLDYSLPARHSNALRIGPAASGRDQVEIRYGQYHSTQGVMTPWEIQRWVNGREVMNLQVNQVLVNSGLPAGGFLSGVGN